MYRDIDPLFHPRKTTTSTAFHPKAVIQSKSHTALNRHLQVGKLIGSKKGTLVDDCELVGRDVTTEYGGESDCDGGARKINQSPFQTNLKTKHRIADSNFKTLNQHCTESEGWENSVTQLK
jgi:hypothetical protein